MPNKSQRLSGYDDCPLGKTCAPGSPNCRKCPEYIDSEWVDNGHENVCVTTCAVPDTSPLVVEFEISKKNEATASPWWSIIDPKQSFRTDSQALYDIASMITGPFFSREAAQRHLDAKHYRFSKNAKVFCHSGHDTEQYAQKVRF
jgi:hypothetical protein